MLWVGAKQFPEPFQIVYNEPPEPWTSHLGYNIFLNHIDVDSVPIISIKNDKVLESIWSTAEHTLYLILSIVRHTTPSIELQDKTLGIIGDGRLGKMVEYLCQNIFHVS